jgi:hypothetical protein
MPGAMPLAGKNDAFLLDQRNGLARFRRYWLDDPAIYKTLACNS